MDAFELVTMIGESMCNLAHGATSPLGVPYVCSRSEYFDTGTGTLALLAIVLLVAWNEARRRRNRPDGYR
jgi:hypothetical protein